VEGGSKHSPVNSGKTGQIRTKGGAGGLMEVVAGMGGEMTPMNPRSLFLSLSLSIYLSLFLSLSLTLSPARLLAANPSNINVPEIKHPKPET